MVERSNIEPFLVHTIIVVGFGLFHQLNAVIYAAFGETGQSQLNKVALVYLTWLGPVLTRMIIFRDSILVFFIQFNLHLIGRTVNKPSRHFQGKLKNTDKKSFRTSRSISSFILGSWFNSTWRVP